MDTGVGFEACAGEVLDGVGVCCGRGIVVKGDLVWWESEAVRVFIE